MAEKDSVVESLSAAIAGYAKKSHNDNSQAWIEQYFSSDATTWDSEAQLKQDAVEIIAMTDAFDQERERFDAARAEGRSRANYLMGRIDEAIATSGVDNPQKVASSVYETVMEDGAALLSEIDIAEAPEKRDVPQESETNEEWSEDSKGEMAKDMTNVLGARGVLLLGKLSEGLVSALEQRAATGDDGDDAITDYIEKQSAEKSCKGLAIPMSAAIVKCARKGLLGETLKKVPADAITTATCVASEGVKTLIKVGKGELTLDEGREKIAESVTVAAGAYVGKKVGEKAGQYLGNLVGGVFGPVGSGVCGKICGKVGAFVGQKVGAVVGKVVYKVGKVYREARKWVGEKIRSGAKRVGRAIVSGVKKVWRKLKSWF